MIAVARTETQCVADATALAGARILNGSQANNNSYDMAASTAQQTATANSILGQTVQDSQVESTIGKYYFDENQEGFVAYPVDAGSYNNPDNELEPGQEHGHE